MNYKPLSVKILDGIPNFATHSPMKMVVIVVAVVFVVMMAFISFEDLFFITMMNWLLVFVFGNGPRMS